MQKGTCLIRLSLEQAMSLKLQINQDIGPWPFLNNPWQFALAWNNDNGSFSKDFIGAQALSKSNWEKHTLAFAGWFGMSNLRSPDVSPDIGSPITSFATISGMLLIGFATAIFGLWLLLPESATVPASAYPRKSY